MRHGANLEARHRHISTGNWRLGASLLALGLAAAASPTWAADAATAAAAAPAPGGEVAEVVVNGVPYRETVLPTRLPNSSTYGIDMNVMETPRSTTLLSTTQLETLEHQRRARLLLPDLVELHRRRLRHAEHPARCAPSTPTCSTTACATA